MANDNEMRIVLAADDEYSAVLEQAAGKAEKTAARITNSFERTSPASATAGFDAYAAAIDKATAAESAREQRANETTARKVVAAQSTAQAIEDPGQIAADDARGYQARLYALYEFNDAVMQEVQRARSAQAGIEGAYTEAEIGYARRKRDLQILYIGETFGMASNVMQNLYVLTGKKNKDMFEMMKAFAIAETLIATYSAAQKSFDKGITETGSYWGGIAYAAAATIAGMARVSEIQRQQPGEGSGGSISASGSANPSYQGGSSSAYPVPQRLERDTVKAPQQVTVNIYNPLSDQNWQKIVDENIVPAINDAANRNIVLTVKNMG